LCQSLKWWVKRLNWYGSNAGSGLGPPGVHHCAPHTFHTLCGPYARAAVAVEPNIAVCVVAAGHPPCRCCCCCCCHSFALGKTLRRLCAYHGSTPTSQGGGAPGTATEFLAVHNPDERTHTLSTYCVQSKPYKRLQHPVWLAKALAVLPLLLADPAAGVDFYFGKTAEIFPQFSKTSQPTQGATCGQTALAANMTVDAATAPPPCLGLAPSQLRTTAAAAADGNGRMIYPWNFICAFCLRGEAIPLSLSLTVLRSVPPSLTGNAAYGSCESCALLNMLCARKGRCGWRSGCRSVRLQRSAAAAHCV
jgi:hypothetical protein